MQITIVIITTICMIMMMTKGDEIDADQNNDNDELDDNSKNANGDNNIE